MTAVDARLEVVVVYLPLHATSPDQRRRLSVTGTGGPAGQGVCRDAADARPFVADIDLETRRALVRDVAGLDGIDFVEVLSNHEGTPGEVAGAPHSARCSSTC